jgi:hypothetical protein
MRAIITRAKARAVNGCGVAETKGDGSEKTAAETIAETKSRDGSRDSEDIIDDATIEFLRP